MVPRLAIKARVLLQEVRKDHRSEAARGRWCVSDACMRRSGRGAHHAMKRTPCVRLTESSMNTTGIGARRSRSFGAASERVEKQVPARWQVPQKFRRIPEPKAVDGRRPRAARVGGWPPLSRSTVDVNINVDVNVGEL